MLEYTALEVNPFGELTYIVWDTDTHQAGIIDPGMSNAREQQAVADVIARHHLTLQWIVNTHLHLDHAFGIDWVKEKYGVKLHASMLDAPLGERIPQQAVMFHLPFTPRPVVIDTPLAAGDTVALGNYTFTVLASPGHTPGGIVLYCAQAGIAFTGDSIFNGSIGRTDLPGGNHHELLDSVRGILAELPPDTLLLPGHGPSTTAGHELAHNPFL